MSIFRILNGLHTYFLPQREGIGFIPYVNLIFMSLYFGNLYFYPVAGYDWAFVVIGVFAFLVMYFRAYWAREMELIYLICGICAIAVGLSELNLGASVIFVYAAGFCGLISRPKKAQVVLVAVICFNCFVFCRDK